METPGVSLVKSRKLRPLLGRPRMAAWSILSAPSARVVSMTGASPVTTTSSCTLETFMVKGRLMVWPTERLRPSRTRVAKPVRLTLTR